MSFQRALSSLVLSADIGTNTVWSVSDRENIYVYTNHVIIIIFPMDILRKLHRYMKVCNRHERAIHTDGEYFRQEDSISISSLDTCTYNGHQSFSM